MKRLGILVLLFCFLFAGCSQQDQATENAKDQDSGKAKSEEQNQANKKEEANAKQEIPAVSKKYISKIEEITVAATRDGLKQQPAGSLTENIPYEKETEEITWALPDLKEAKRQKLEKALKKLTSATQDPKMLQKGLIYLLGSPNYERAIGDAEGFQPNFTKPYLPDPTKLKSTKAGKAPDKAIILLDASSSMLLEVNGQRKMKIAKEAVERFAKTIGQGKDNEVSLVVYGHKGSESDADKHLSCTSIEEIYPMAEYKEKAFEKAMTTFQAKGWTPLAGAIQKAAKMSQSYQKGVTVYIVSDGKETCGGNPVKAAKQLASKHDNSTVNIIGFDVDANAEDQLSRVAKAGDGKYYSADNPKELKSTIEYKWLPSYLDLAWAFTKGPSGYDIADEYDRFDHKLAKIRAILHREDHRYQIAIRILEEKELISDKKIEKLDQMRESRYETIQEMTKAFRQEKFDQVDQAAKQIRKQIQQWTEKMSKLKQQQGDMW